MSVKETNSQPATQNVAVNQPGNLGDKSVVQWQKPLGFVLIFLGVAGVGAAAYLCGAHQGWIPGPSFSDLSQIQALAISSSSGIIGIALVGVGIYLIRQEKTEEIEKTEEVTKEEEPIKPILTLENIAHFKIGGYKSLDKFNKFYHCTLTFDDGQVKEAYLSEYEIANFVVALDKKKVQNDSPCHYFTQSHLHHTNSPAEILEFIDTEVKNREKML